MSELETRGEHKGLGLVERVGFRLNENRMRYELKTKEGRLIADIELGFACKMTLPVMFRIFERIAAHCVI